MLLRALSRSIPMPYAIEPVIVAAFVMHQGIVRKAKGQHVRILCLDRSEIVGDRFRKCKRHRVLRLCRLYERFFTLH
jgi:hypothetical protein